jgi:hypothetical protein
MKHKFQLLLLLIVMSISCTQKSPVEETVYISRDMTGWIPYTNNMIAEGSALDMSFLLSPPAGKNGFLKVQGDKFFFENGAPARFWGANLAGEACFPDKEEAEQLADLISRLGYNIVRFHHVDVVAPWTDKVIQRSLFGGQQPQTTRKIDPVMLDKLEYLWYCLKEKGVYIKLSHLSSRKIMQGDGFPGPADAFSDVTAGLKLEAEIDPYLVGLQQNYLKQLLTHKNPYTGLSIVEDPALALIEIINEDALLYYGVGEGFSTKSEYYTKIFQSLFNKWLKTKFKTTNALVERWSSPDTSKKGLLVEENLEKGNIRLLQNLVYDDLSGWSDQRVKDTYQFLYDEQLGYYKKMYAFLRETGIRCPITGSNHWINAPADLLANTYTDFIDRHTYWQHPEHNYNYDTGQVVGPLPMVRSDYAGNIGSLATRRVYGIPYAASEWHNPLPNKFRSEGPVIMAAIACLQDWHPMQYALALTTLKNPDMINSFEYIYDPSHMNVIPSASLMFQRRDISEATRAYFEIMNEEQVMNPSAPTGTHPLIALTGKYGVAFPGRFPGAPADKALLEYVSDTGNFIFGTDAGDLEWNNRQGLVIFNSPFTQGFAGFAQKQPVICADLTLDIDNQFAVVMVSSLTAKPITQSDHLLITTSGDSQWQGVKFNDDGKVVERGHPPFLMEPVTGTITMQLPKGCTVFKLDTDGTRKGEIQVKNSAKGISIALHQDCLHYEITCNVQQQ